MYLDDQIKKAIKLASELDVITSELASLLPESCDLQKSNGALALDIAPDVQQLTKEVKEKFNPRNFNYFSKMFRRMRHEIFVRDGEYCKICGREPIDLCEYGKYLSIDHIKPVSKFPELALEPSNLQVLCIECNKEKSNKVS